ncbi:hypothetical protein AKJ16_DCAP02865 [Drosera capensis]
MLCKETLGGDDKSTPIVMMASGSNSNSRDRELLIPVADSDNNDDSAKPSSSISPLDFLDILQSSQKLGFQEVHDRVFMSSWLGASVLGLGEWFIKRMPFVRHIYIVSKQISSAISPDQNSQAFKEVAIIRHPRIGEYAFGFITSWVTLQMLMLGSDIFLVNFKDVIRPNLSVREGIGKYFPPLLEL